MNAFILLALAIWLSLSVGFVAGTVWCGMCRLNKRLDGPVEEEGER